MTDFMDELDEIVGPRNTKSHAEARLALEIAVQFVALRERRGLTQKQLAEKLGRTQQAVSKIENPSHGGHNLARLKDVLAQLDATLDVTIVPLEDLVAYESLYIPKPTLEDIHLQSEERSAPSKVTGQFSAPVRRVGLRASNRVASYVPQLHGRYPLASGVLQRPWTSRFQIGGQ